MPSTDPQILTEPGTTGVDAAQPLERSTQLSGDLFDDVLCPLAETRKAEGVPAYFPKWRDGSVASYFCAPDVGKMSADAFGYPGGGSSERLVDALVDWWAGEGETVLASTGPRLHVIVEALHDEAVSQDANVDIFCYTLF